MRRVQCFPLQKCEMNSGSSRSLEEPSFASCSFTSANMESTSSTPKSMRRASSPPPVTPHTSSESPVRRTASSPSFCFLPCSLSGLLQESPGSTPTPPERCETEANFAGIKKQTVKTGNSSSQLPFQGFTPGYWETDLWSRSTQTEVTTESRTQTEPLTISSDSPRLNDSDDTRHSFSWKFAPRWNSTPFLMAVAALVTFAFVLVVVGTVLGTYNSQPKMDGFEPLPDLFENELPIAVVREKLVNITAPTTALAETTAPVVAKTSVTAVHAARSAKMRKATNTVHRESIATEGARGTTYATRNLPTTAGLPRTSTPPTTIGHRKGVQVVGTHDPAQRKYHLEEVTGDNEIPSHMVNEFDKKTMSELPGEYATFRPKKRMNRSPSTTPAGDFVDEIV